MRAAARWSRLAMGRGFDKEDDEELWRLDATRHRANRPTMATSQAENLQVAEVEISKLPIWIVVALLEGPALRVAQSEARKLSA